MCKLTTKRKVILAIVCCIGYGVVMSVSRALPMVWERAIIAGIGGGLLGFLLTMLMKKPQSM